MEPSVGKLSNMTRALFMATLVALPLAAAPNLSGSWILNLAKSQYGQFPAPEVMMQTTGRGSERRIAGGACGARGAD